MGSIRTPTLRAFQGIYQIAGGARGLAEIHEGSPIQVVADVERLAEIGSGFGNFWGFDNHSMATDHNGVTTSFQTLDPYAAAIMTSLQTRAEECWCWLLDASLRYTSSLTIQSALLGVRQAVITGAITNHDVPLALWNQEQAPFISGAADDLALSTFPLPGTVPFPRLLPPGCTLGFRATTAAAGGAGTSFICQLLTWYGPRGVLPPGMP